MTRRWPVARALVRHAGRDEPHRGEVVTENDVESAIVGWLRAQVPAWIVDRNNVGVFTSATGSVIRTGRKGQCDWRAVRRNGDHLEYCEIEVKATGARPSKEQVEYMALRRHQGIPVTWADSLEMFVEWYNKEFE